MNFWLGILLRSMPKKVSHETQPLAPKRKHTRRLIPSHEGPTCPSNRGASGLVQGVRWSACSLTGRRLDPVRGMCRGEERGARTAPLSWSAHAYMHPPRPPKGYFLPHTGLQPLPASNEQEPAGVDPARPGIAPGQLGPGCNRPEPAAAVASSTLHAVCTALGICSNIQQLKRGDGRSMV